MKIFLIPAIAVIAIVFSVSIAKAYSPANNYLQIQGGYAQTSFISEIPLTSLSMEFWVKPESLNGQQKILSIGIPDEKPFYEIGINGGSISFDYRQKNNSYTFITSGNIQHNGWNHIGTNISSSETSLFLNGARIFKGTGASNLMPLGGMLRVGKSVYKFYSAGYRGDFDSLRISTGTKDFPGNWNKGIYESSLLPDNESLLIWNFEGSRGLSSISDSTGKLNGILVGNDSQIHYFGVLPSPTPFVPQITERNRWILPTIGFPDRTITRIPVAQPTTYLFPTVPENISGRYDRPVYTR